MEKDIDKKIKERLRLSHLIARKQIGIITTEEEKELATLIGSDDHFKQLAGHIMQQTATDDLSNEGLNNREIQFHWKEFKKKQQSSSKETSFWRKSPFARYVAGIATVAALISGYLFLINPPTRQPDNQMEAKQPLATTISTAQGQRTDTPFCYLTGPRNLDFGIRYGKYAPIQPLPYFLPDIANSHRSHPKEAVTTEGSFFDIYTSDSSCISLNQCTVLRYLAEFDAEKREVWLKSGEAYFQIQRDEERPFLVHVGELTIQVLGTQFNVRAYPDFPIQVTLVSGSILLKAPEGEIAVHPGETATYTNKHLTLAMKDNKKLLAWTQNRFYLEEVTMKEVTEVLSKWYGIKLKCKDKETEQQIVSLDSDRRYAPISVLQKIETQNSNFIICFKQTGINEMTAYTMDKESYYSSN